MEYILDTHTLIWFMNGDTNIPANTVDKIKNKNNDCYISIASLWEIAIKISVGKLTLDRPFNDIIPFLIEYNIEILQINFEHLQKLLTLELIHRDPFDRIIIAQAITQNLTAISRDKNFKFYPVNCIW